MHVFYIVEAKLESCVYIFKCSSGFRVRVLLSLSDSFINNVRQFSNRPNCLLNFDCSVRDEQFWCFLLLSCFLSNFNLIVKYTVSQGNLCLVLQLLEIFLHLFE